MSIIDCLNNWRVYIKIYILFFGVMNIFELGWYLFLILSNLWLKMSKWCVLMLSLLFDIDV